MSKAPQMTPEQFVQQCDLVLQLIPRALSHPQLPQGPHERRFPPPAGFEALYSRIYKKYRDPSYFLYAEPVNSFEYSDNDALTNYYTVIKKPMCLRVILDKLAAGTHYENEHHVRADLRVMIENSSFYNGPHHEVTAAAQKLMKEIDEETRQAPPEQVDVFQSMSNDADEETMRRVFHTIKTDAPHLVEGEDMVDVEHLCVGLVADCIEEFRKSKEM